MSHAPALRHRHDVWPVTRATEQVVYAPGLFFGLVGLLSVPFWIAGRFTAWQMLPGVPISAWMFVCPALAALILVARSGGRVAACAWIRQTLQLRAAGRGRWVAVAVVTPAAALVAAYLWMRISGHALPQHIEMDFGRMPLVFAAFVLTGVFEQLGWSSYATRALQVHHSALAGSLMVGVAWAAWHVIPLQQAGRELGWIAWWCVMTMMLRVVLTWLYNSAGASVIVVAVCQAAANTGWQFFPNYGSHYDPKVAGLMFMILAAVIVARHGPRWLASAPVPP